jgi:hypothetical protein
MKDWNSVPFYYPCKFRVCLDDIEASQMGDVRLGWQTICCCGRSPCSGHILPNNFGNLDERVGVTRRHQRSRASGACLASRVVEQ